MIRHDSSLLHNGQNRQLFFDNKIIERAQDIRRAFHSPRAEPEPVMQADQPWETISYFSTGTGHVIRDRDSRFHCWYADWDLDPVGLAKNPADWYSVDVSLLRLCYARSADGIHWEKPPSSANSRV